MYANEYTGSPTQDQDHHNHITSYYQLPIITIIRVITRLWYITHALMQHMHDLVYILLVIRHWIMAYYRPGMAYGYVSNSPIDHMSIALAGITMTT